MGYIEIGKNDSLNSPDYDYVKSWSIEISFIKYVLLKYRLWPQKKTISNLFQVYFKNVSITH